jgi:vancomycin permeability regulator SanA
MRMWLFASLLITVPPTLFLLAIAFANLWVILSSQKHLVENPEHASSADVILILGAPVPSNNTPGPIVEDRLQCGLALFGQKKAPRIVLSGRSQTNGASEVVAMEKWLRARNVPAEAIALDEHAHRTIDSATNLSTFPFKPQRVLVCSQRFHLGRAVFLLKRKGFWVEGVVADGRIYRDRHKFAFRESLGRLRAVFETFVGD